MTAERIEEKRVLRNKLKLQLTDGERIDNLSISPMIHWHDVGLVFPHCPGTWSVLTIDR